MESLNEFIQYLNQHDLSYVLLIIVLFILPRLLGRLGLPISLGGFALGYLCANELGIFKTDQIIPVFSTLGISALFLYAGLEIDFVEIRANFRLLAQHLVVRAVLIALFAAGLQFTLSLRLSTSVLIALALLTPSTGFIFESLHSSGLTEEQKRWVKNKAIAAEVLALILLLLFQSKSPTHAFSSIFIILALIICLPLLFHWVSKRVSIKTPGADFSFLLLLAVAAGTLTKKLGAYYLVGAFLVGFTVNFYEKNIAHDPKEEFEHAAKFFASFFMPFYFFHAGIELNPAVLSGQAIVVGSLLILLTMPIRLLSISLHRKLSIHEHLNDSLPIAIALLPNLVFGLVLVEILELSGEVSFPVLGGLVIYTFAMTLMPSLFLKFVLRRDDLLDVSDPSLAVGLGRQASKD